MPMVFVLLKWANLLREFYDFSKAPQIAAYFLLM